MATNQPRGGGLSQLNSRMQIIAQRPAIADRLYSDWDTTLRVVTRMLTLVANSLPARRRPAMGGLVRGGTNSTASERKIDSWLRSLEQKGLVYDPIPILSGRSRVAIIFRQPNHLMA